MDIENFTKPTPDLLIPETESLVNAFALLAERVNSMVPDSDRKTSAFIAMAEARDLLVVEVKSAMKPFYDGEGGSAGEQTAVQPDPERELEGKEERDG